MSREKALDCRVIGSTVKIEICVKVERKYRHSPKDTFSIIYARALEDSVRDVELNVDDYKKIAVEIEQNRKAREAKRIKERKASSKREAR